ncbi:choice-of-anchor J domain-containing protein [Chengkuizengella axinellae]|uniref:Choice-of-anchor J domain-containing protein n=1 Tax=Chengkuizengella axinellae TaxID=3064388 RepID=A0ABT9IW36_9BACL|nr:choice-of-anchor J domain-containing protein [Chengkuizengella sp. 2205SS18-9]MDP5273576.1 choice-of-anchor J domain-containing protein [Chengkuizengella sp. 2205SS18-9]
MWERANPQSTSYSGSKQLGTTTSGSFGLVTGASAGSSVGANDIDNGNTSILSPEITLPADGNLTLTFSSYFSHYSNATSADFFSLSVIQANGNEVTLFEELGAGVDQDANWSNQTIDLSAYAGQTIQLQFEAADAAGGSLVEAGVDDVKIEQSTVNALLEPKVD